MDKTCNDCKWLRYMFGCQSGRLCLNYDCFEPKEMIEVSRAEYNKMKSALETICKFDLKPYENEYFYGANKLKMIAYEALNG